MGKDLLCRYCDNQSKCLGDSRSTCELFKPLDSTALLMSNCELFEPSDSITVLISTNELLDKLADKDAYEKMTVHTIRELIMSCNKIFYKDPHVLLI